MGLLEIFGYIDPASGSVFIQALIGGVLAVSFALRRYVQTGLEKLKKIF